MGLLCTKSTHSQGFPLKISSIDESIKEGKKKKQKKKKERKKSCPPLVGLMPCCQLAVRSRKEVGAMLINISASDTFNQQLQLGQCICKKKKKKSINIYFDFPLIWCLEAVYAGGNPASRVKEVY